MSIRIRQSVPEDAEAIAEIQVRSFQAGLSGIHSAETLAALDPAPRVPLWRERSAFVAEDEEGIAGLVQVGPSKEDGVGEIYRLFVAPERWGKGVGQALIGYAREQLKSAGSDQALLWVHAGNRRARSFYEAGGWQADGAEKDQEALGHLVRLLCCRIRLR